MEYGKVLKARNMQDSGVIVRLKDMEFIYVKMEINMKVNSGKMLNMEVELIFSKMEIFILVIIEKESQMVMESMYGKMGHITLVTLYKVREKVQVNGVKRK